MSEQKRKRNGVDYTNFDKIVKEDEAEEEKQKDPIKEFFYVDNIRSRLMGSDGPEKIGSSFTDSCKMFWHHYKQHKMSNIQKKIDPNSTDKQLEDAMQYWYDHARAFFRLYCHDHLEIKRLSENFLEYVALLEQFKRFTSLVDPLKFINTENFKQNS